MAPTAAIIETTPIGSSLPKDNFVVSSSPVAVDEVASIDAFIRYQAKRIPDTVVFGYPGSELGADDFVNYTMRQIDQYADQAASKLTQLGLRPSKAVTGKSEVVAILGPSNFDYIISILALSRIGFSVLFLSTRLATEAYASLLKKTNCSRVLSTSKFESALKAVEEQGSSVQTFPILEKSVYSQQSTQTFTRETDVLDEESQVAFIVHSSGSTGLPKPIFQTHRQCLANYALGSGLKAFVTLPLFHNHGLATTFRGLLYGKRTALYNSNLPLTSSNLLKTMRGLDFESFHGVPYALKLLAETEEGIQILAKAKLVLFGGSSCPDDLGDLLVSQGVNLVSHYGATEMGQLMTSTRDQKTDKLWNYLRPLKLVKPYLLFDQVSDGIFELVVLDGLVTKTISDCDDPPNSYRTRDIFTKHESFLDHWKYLGRLDDRVTLFNGEKVLPVPFEHRVRQHELVQECLVVGVGRAFPGLFIFASDHAQGNSSNEILSLLWPTIEDANSRAEEFGRVAREMVHILAPGAEYPRTDKGTVIRSAAYKLFDVQIEALYQKFEEPGDANKLALELPELEEWLLELLRETAGLSGLKPSDDFFARGMDSLRAIAVRAHILRSLDLGGATLGQTVAFDYPSVSQLAAYLHALRTSTSLVIKPEEEVMQELREKYSHFKPFKGGSEVPDGETVVLTGATGSLGAHVLHQLLELPTVQHVYCLVRASSPSQAQERVIDSLAERGLSVHKDAAQRRIHDSLVDRGLSRYHHTSKFTALPADLSQSDLGLGQEAYDALSTKVTAVIHSAWAVNFTLNVSSFEAQHIAGTRHLLDLCLSVPFSRPARMSFVSSISVGAGTPPPCVVPETLVDNPSHAHPMGYARSKWVAEHMIAAAAANGMEARVLRSGQIMGDSVFGKWNPTEALPLMFQAALTIGALPALDETPSWLPVDISARAVLELSGLLSPLSSSTSGYFARNDPASIVYHVQNIKTARWTEEILPALAAAGLDFETVPQREWIKRLRESDQDPVKNPTTKLTDFFAQKYDNDGPGRKGIEFATEQTERRSEAIAGGYNIIDSGLLGKCIDSWKREWQGS